MRKLGFALRGLLAGAGIALVLAWPQSPGARAMDPQGLHRSIYLVFPRETILSQSEQAFVRFCRQMAIRRNL